ncbi:MAG: hypothetical protein LBT02_01445 [Rickettsiales bacterium]|jgi:hypothetical protein|nr:hypothetical protein [Rickettsiales bacterium]
MFRNLIYSFVIHIILFGFLFLSIIDIIKTRSKVSLVSQEEITPKLLGIIDNEIINEIKPSNIINVDVTNMTIEQKLDLYRKIKNQQKVNKALSKYEANGGNTIETENVFSNVENVFSYYYTPIYVVEYKLTESEKEIFTKDHEKKEEIRKRIRQQKIVPQYIENDEKNFKNIQEALAMARKPLQMESKKNNNEIEEKYKNINENEIFTKQDLAKLKELLANENNRITLTLRERQNVQQQIKSCYKMAITKSKKNSLNAVDLVVNISENGIIDLKNITIIDEKETEDYQIAFENAKTALIFCNPLKNLPLNKYSIWKKMSFTFDSNMLN